MKLYCPRCKQQKEFRIDGLQDGLHNGKELYPSFWVLTCLTCYNTFADESLIKHQSFNDTIKFRKELKDEFNRRTDQEQAHSFK